MKTVNMIGNAHIDPVWLWQWREGYHEVRATFRSALDRMEETAEFVFTCACACYYQWVEESDPEMFEEIRARVREGRWAIVGGMWIQPDMNTPSGESLARQLLYSQRYFYEKFGMTATVGYNVDSFGHNAMTPQLLRKAGIDHYVWMRPSVVENPEIPEGAMIWEAPDGSRVKAYRIYGEYVSREDLTPKIEDLFAFSERIGMPVMCFYGVGNHGGGPTIAHLKKIDDYRANGAHGDAVGYASPMDYFAGLAETGILLPVWKNELQHHASGCYSTHSASKHLHRRTENALLRMETLSVLANRLTGYTGKQAFVEQAWKDLMFNQFHDVMGGCCMPEGMEDVLVQLGEAVAIADREETAAIQRISWQVDTIKGLPARVRSKEENGRLWGIDGQGTPIVVFNPHAFDAEGTVRLHTPIRAVRDDAGHSVSTQLTRASRTDGKDCWDAIFRAQVPALGYRLYWVFLSEDTAAESSLRALPTLLENEYISAQFDEKDGSLIHLIDKKTGFDALNAPAAVRLMDIEHCDTWAHNVFRFDCDAGCFAGEQAVVEECGPVRAVVRTVSRFGTSTLTQRYILYADADQLEVENILDLHEKHRMVKFCYPTSGTHDVVEIPCGVLERRGNGDEEHCQRWAAVQGEAGGLALINDGKYSYSAPNGELRMTVANTSVMADHYGQQYRDDSCRFMDLGEQRFTCVLVPYVGAWQAAHLNCRASLLNRSLPHVAETYHEGPLGGEYRGMTLDNTRVEMLALKRAQDGAGYVLRCVETTGAAQQVHLALHLLGRDLTLNFTPFEIKTLYLPDDPAQPVREIPLTELE